MKKYIPFVLSLLLLCGCADKDVDVDAGTEDIESNLGEAVDAPHADPQEYIDDSQMNYSWTIRGGEGTRSSVLCEDGKLISFERDGNTTTFCYYDDWYYLGQNDTWYHIVGDFDFDVDHYPNISAEGLEFVENNSDLDIYHGVIDGKDCYIRFSATTQSLTSIVEESTLVKQYSDVNGMYLPFDPYATDIEEIDAAEANRIYDEAEFMPTSAYVIESVTPEPEADGEDTASGPEPEDEVAVTTSPIPEAEVDSTLSPTPEVEATSSPTPDSEETVTAYILISNGEYNNMYGCYAAFGTDADSGENIDDPETAQFQFEVGDKVYCWPTCPEEASDSVTFEAFRSILNSR